MLGERARALPLLRAAVAYKQEIGHVKAAKHAALLAQIEAGVRLSTDLLHAGEQGALASRRNGVEH